MTISWYLHPEAQGRPTHMRTRERTRGYSEDEGIRVEPERSGVPVSRETEAHEGSRRL